MTRLTLIAAALLAASAIPAGAVTVTFSVGATTFTTNISTMSAMRFATWAAGAYPTIPNPAYTPTCGCSQTLPNPNSGQTALQQAFEGMKNNVLSSEKQTGVAAVPDPAPIN